MVIKMKFGIFADFGFELTAQERARLIKEAGFDTVLLWWGGDNRKTRPEIFLKAGLEIENVHIPFNSCNSLWRIGGRKYVKRVLDCIEDCGKFSIPAAVMHISAGNKPPRFNRLGLKRLRRIIERCEKNGVDLALENLRKPEYLDYVFENIKSERLKFCYDSGHQNCWSPNSDLLEKYGGKLCALHLHDNDGSGDKHMLPFHGNINWEEVMRKIKKSGYKGPVALEVISDADSREQPAVYLSSAMESAKKLAALL